MINSIILGIIQGITEFLPVSSSGHLIVLKKFLQKWQLTDIMHKNDDLYFIILVHFATLLAVIIFFRKQIISLGKGILHQEKAAMQYCKYIIAATVPTAVIGFFLEEYLTVFFSTTVVVAFFFIITAILLGLTRFKIAHNKDLTLVAALIIGIVQGLAVIPGISRSGSTIAVALLLGINRNKAGEFSFLIAIPVILGVTLLKFTEADVINNFVLADAFGAGAAFISGYFSLKLLMSFVKKGNLYNFSYYLCLLGGGLLIYLMLYL